MGASTWASTARQSPVRSLLGSFLRRRAQVSSVSPPRRRSCRCASRPASSRAIPTSRGKNPSCRALPARSAGPPTTARRSSSSPSLPRTRTRTWRPRLRPCEDARSSSRPPATPTRTRRTTRSSTRRPTRASWRSPPQMPTVLPRISRCTVRTWIWRCPLQSFTRPGSTRPIAWSAGTRAIRRCPPRRTRRPTPAVSRPSWPRSSPTSPRTCGSTASR